MKGSVFRLLFCAFGVLILIDTTSAEEIDPLAANKRAAETRDLRNALIRKEAKNNQSLLFSSEMSKHLPAAKSVYKPYDFLGPLKPSPVPERDADPTPGLKIDFDPVYQKFIRTVSTRDKQPFAFLFPNIPVISSVSSNRIYEDDILPSIVALPAPSKCSGTRVGKNIVLSAAHCLCNPPTEIQYGARVSALGSGKSLAVLGTWRPEGIQCSDDASNHGRDIALLQITDRPAISNQIPVMRVATDRVLEKLHEEDVKIFVVGYGYTSEILKDYGHKNFVESPILSVDCGPAQAPRYGCVEGKELVARDHRRISGRLYGFGPCFGDSGGAALVHMDDPDTPNNDPQYFLVAVISRPVDGARMCGDGAIFTLLSAPRISELKSAATQLLGYDFSFAENEAARQVAQR
jgi:hypothetical protein